MRFRLFALAGLLAVTGCSGTANNSASNAATNTSAAKRAAPAPAPTTQANMSSNASSEVAWQTTASGLKYRRIEGNGTGPKPTLSDTITFHYVGRLLDGTEFDSSIARGEPATMPLGSVIPGWQEGVPLMSVGDVYEFQIPGPLAYGERGSPPVIPPNATLYFKVGLLAIER